MRTERRPWWRSRWWMPLFCLLLGGLIFGAMAIGGDAGGGLMGFGVMAAVGALFWFGGRSETIRGLGGPGRDERWTMIDLRASVFAGGVVISVVLGAWLWELAHGREGDAYARIAAVGGVAYVLAVAVLRARS